MASINPVWPLICVPRIISARLPRIIMFGLEYTIALFISSFTILASSRAGPAGAIDVLRPYQQIG